jgi:exopolysaccharide biosynthesis polyprenyl glycosylphosphotransferase
MPIYALTRLKQLILLIGDVLIFYGSLYLLLVVRYGYESYTYIELLPEHLASFTTLLPLWIILFYIGGLYDLGALKNNELFAKKFWGVLAAATIGSVLYFYFVPGEITPKTNLFLFMILIAGTTYAWRYVYNGIIGIKKASERLLVIGRSPIVNELMSMINRNPQLGYIVSGTLEKIENAETLHRVVAEQQIKTVVMPSQLRNDHAATAAIEHELARGTNMVDVITLYERLFSKTPLEETEKVGLLARVAEHRTMYASLITPIEKLLAVAMAIILLPLGALIVAAITLTSRGGTIYAQTRVGKYGKPFTLYKFRTMRNDAEKNGAQWAAENDPRLTVIGKVLRTTHLDELPQLWNILRGELSFVGPRPERPEFIAQLKREMPYYELRHLVNPGITGWAQLNYRYGRSVHDACEKLSYDLFYIKHRSPLLDLAIIVRTAKLLIINN